MEARDKENIDFLFDRMMSGEILETERDELRHYIEATCRDEQLNRLMEKHWNSLDSRIADRDGLTEIRWRMRRVAGIPDEQTLPILGNRRWLVYLSRIAAMLAIPLMILSGYLFIRLEHQQDVADVQPTMQEVIATPGARVRFILPDHSEVWLNSGSSLQYDTRLYVGNQRRVRLRGEGYFRVVRDEKSPFIVETDALNIKVLGTEFNVSDYANDDFASSTLEEGAIALLNRQGEQTALLKPGEQALFTKHSNKLEILQVDTRLSTSWKDGKLIFRNSPLKDVTSQLERWFNCSIRVDPALMKAEIRYTATIQNETLGEVLQMVEISTRVKTKIKNREVRIWSE